MKQNKQEQAMSLNQQMEQYINHFLDEDLTRIAYADNTQGVSTKYDVTVFVSQDGTNWETPIIVDAILGLGKRTDTDISNRKFVVQKFQFMWHDGHLNWKKGNMVDAGSDYYYPIIGIRWIPAIEFANNESVVIEDITLERRKK